MPSPSSSSSQLSKSNNAMFDDETLRKADKFKLVVLGESSVGKTSLVIRLDKNCFFQYQESTIGAAFSTQFITVGDRVIKFEVWDTAGQERYKSLAPMYYRGSECAIVVYDITNMESFHRAKYWVKELQRQSQTNMVIALAGNKLDLQDEKRQVDHSFAQAYAEDNGLIFMETSAKENINVREVFETLARKMPLREDTRVGEEDTEEEDHPSSSNGGGLVVRRSGKTLTRPPSVRSSKRITCCGGASQ
ncbi:hypothetical protein FDP41_004357 [Naegleria fowleri]|uniref:Uncharacterized protein n=1 Tax=Naegleria fowleri TaxID=5763 RepID=A0A6A5BQF1_NAEFO|nr:uncharacterized protein FDP41_004968 [Naegleria fowleri]XP_044561171.1 uncharacterized protein FDP41_004357 [Naegleria fowleri]KAF0976002.1 hypothetical protein FDP41_004968 [Naegleria fowleri]KAF0976458.1 hypothetical protein FDP41_004357 [Naegleria fowleri]CAG4715273.1 unnamed protein product [Naegleria fowleri]